jgi:predicted aldo/keto reductase-like oxidoreductase
MTDFQPLSRDELLVIEKAREAIGKIRGIPCTACQYCVDGCPRNIPIPKIFSAYNRKVIFNDAQSAQLQYAAEVFKRGKPADCIACGNCEQVCPQRIGIIEILKTIGKELAPFPFD